MENVPESSQANPKIIEENAGVIINNTRGGNSQQIAGAIIVAGILIAGAVLLRGNGPSVDTQAVNKGTTPPVATTVAKVTQNDRTIGNANAKVTLVMYEDFQCPFCGKFVSESETPIRNTYVADGRVQFVYRDFAFLGPESTRSAEAAMCASDQGKFWEYHDYLFSHQRGENQGNFSDPNLKSFATSLGLNGLVFNQCFDGNKYAKAVADSTTEGGNAGVRGTPKGFILKNGKVVDTIDGAVPNPTVMAKLDAALK